MTSDNNSLDAILDRFSKAHPFADTRAYNVFHEQAKAALNKYIVTKQIQELERLDVSDGRIFRIKERIAELKEIGS